MGTGQAKEQTLGLVLSLLEDDGMMLRMQCTTWWAQIYWRKNDFYRNYVEWLSTINCICYVVFADPSLCNAKSWNSGNVKLFHLAYSKWYWSNRGFCRVVFGGICDTHWKQKIKQESHEATQFTGKYIGFENSVLWLSYFCYRVS